MMTKTDFNIPTMTFSFICSTIPAALAYGLFVSQQLIQYSRAYYSYHDFLAKGLVVSAIKEVTEPRVPSYKFEVIISNVLRSPP